MRNLCYFSKKVPELYRCGDVRAFTWSVGFLWLVVLTSSMRREIRLIITGIFDQHWPLLILLQSSVVILSTIFVTHLVSNSYRRWIFSKLDTSLQSTTNVLILHDNFTWSEYWKPFWYFLSLIIICCRLKIFLNHNIINVF